MQGRKQDTPLVWAARLGNFSEVKRLLLTTNATEWEINGRQENALQVAAFKGHLCLLQWLVAFCGPCYTHDFILTHAILGRQTHVIEWCLQVGSPTQFALCNAQGISTLDAVAMTPDASIVQSLCAAGAVFNKSHLALALTHHNQPFLLKMMTVMPFVVVRRMVISAKNLRLLEAFLDLYPPRELLDCPFLVFERGSKWLTKNISRMQGGASLLVAWAAETGKVSLVKTAMQMASAKGIIANERLATYCLWKAMKHRRWNLARWLIHTYSPRTSVIWRDFLPDRDRFLESLVRGNQLQLLRWFVVTLKPQWDFSLLSIALSKRECFLYLWATQSLARNTNYNLLMDAVKQNNVWFLTRYMRWFDDTQQYDCFRYAVETNNVSAVLVFAHHLGINCHIPGQARSSMIELIVIRDHVHLLHWFYPSAKTTGQLLELACETRATQCAAWLFRYDANAICLAIKSYQPMILDWVIANRIATRELFNFVVFGQQLTWLRKMIQLQPDLVQTALDDRFLENHTIVACAVLEQIWSFTFDKRRVFERACETNEVDTVRWLLKQGAHEGCMIDAMKCSPDVVRIFLHSECFGFFRHGTSPNAGIEKEVYRFVRKHCVARFVSDKNAHKIIIGYLQNDHNIQDLFR
jgi:hypothetical protein